MKEIKITDIKGIKVGHAQDFKGASGCTVIICEKGAWAGVDVRGGGPASRETELLKPINMVEQIHAVMLSGGSAFGLDAASGAMEWLEEQGVGFDTGVAKVPIVCAASIFDLACGRADIRPDKAMGYEACEAASHTTAVEEGCVGAGCGATIGKMFGPARCMKSGLGVSGLEHDGLQVAAVSVVNALGIVIDGEGFPMAGALAEDGFNLVSVEQAEEACVTLSDLPFTTNTTITCIMTNAQLTKAQCTKVAQVTHDGYARAIRPVHTSNDGDAVFVLATGARPAGVDGVGILAANACELAIRSAVANATGGYGYISMGS